MTDVVVVEGVSTVVTENTITNTVIVTAAGPAGAKGDAGLGLPSGGTTGQILVKNSNTNYDTSWSTSTGTGSVTSVALTAPTGFSVTGSPIESFGTLAITFASGYSLPTTASQTNWNAAYTDRLKWDGGSTGLVAATGRSSLGATTLGSNLFTITDPGAITFPRFNANNTVSSLTADDFRTAVGAATAAQGAKADTAVQTIASTDGSMTITGTTAIDLSVAVAGSTSNVLLPVRNTTGATLTKGTAVYISGATGQISTVSKAIATSDATSAQTLGLMTADLANNSNGNVTLIGTITNIDTSAYGNGQQLYLSPDTAGTLTGIKPYAPQHLVYVAVVEHAHPTQGKLFVKVQNGYELYELHDVSAQSPTNGQTLVYNSTNDLWEKNTVSLSIGVNGTLPVANGGTGASTLTGYIKGTGTAALTASSTIPATDISSGAALTKTDDTNVTLTLGGTPASALLAATSITAGWTGQLSVSRGGTGAATLTGVVIGNGTSAFTTVSAPSGAIVGTTDTQTLTNKTFTQRAVAAAATSGNITPNSDTTDLYLALGLTGTTNFQIPSGSPTNGQKLIIRIKDNGTARSLTWVTSAGGYRIIGTTLPTTTAISKTIYIGCIYNTADAFWDVVAISQEA